MPSSLAVPLRSRLARVRAEPAWSPASVSVGKRAVADALFLPAVARQVFAERFVRGTLWVEVVRLPPHCFCPGGVASRGNPNPVEPGPLWHKK